MCRFVASVSNSTRSQHGVLRDAPKSLRALAPEHADGWGIAAYQSAQGWELYKGVQAAHVDPRYTQLTGCIQGSTIIGHIRQKTVGETSTENTHPFESDGWVFAHNGTVSALAWLLARCCPLRRSQVRGSTDSELLFQAILGTWASAGLLDVPSDARDATLARACGEWRGIGGFGSFNFILSDGQTSYVHRRGRSLYCARDENEVLFASEASDDGHAWEEVPDGTLWKVSRHEERLLLRSVGEIPPSSNFSLEG